MGLSRKKGVDLGDVVSVVGPEAYFQGTLTAKGSIRIDGKVEGGVSEAQAVVVGNGGRIIGDISCESAIVGGEVKGNISATKYTELLQTAKVTGDISTSRLVVEDGALFNGSTTMTREDTDDYKALDEEMDNAEDME
jgi:cytoskeletal protein CcmA (bactofilin family)